MLFSLRIRHNSTGQQSMPPWLDVRSIIHNVQ